jgi:hypothetical protein
MKKMISSDASSASEDKVRLDESSTPATNIII